MTREEVIYCMTSYLQDGDYHCLNCNYYQRNTCQSSVAYKMAIEALKEQQSKWVPVSKRLPEESGNYLVTVGDDKDSEYKEVDIAWFAHKNDYNMDESEWRELEDDAVVIAWMLEILEIYFVH